MYGNGKVWGVGSRGWRWGWSCSLWSWVCFVRYSPSLSLLLLLGRCSCRRRRRGGGWYIIYRDEGLKRRFFGLVQFAGRSLVLTLEWDDKSDKSNTPVFYGGGVLAAWVGGCRWVSLTERYL